MTYGEATKLMIANPLVTYFRRPHWHTLQALGAFWGDNTMEIMEVHTDGDGGGCQMAPYTPSEEDKQAKDWEAFIAPTEEQFEHYLEEWEQQGRP